MVWAFALLASACSPSQQQQTQNAVNDAFLAAQIRAKMSAVDAATLSNVKVKVVNHNVTLSGDPDNPLKIERVERIIVDPKNTDGPSIPATPGTSEV